MTVVHVHQKTSLSTGSVQQMIQAARGLNTRGHQTIVITPPSEALAGLVTESGIRHETLPFRNLVDIETVLGLRQLIKEIHPDVIHVHKGLAHWLALLALIHARTPALIVNRGVSFPLTALNRGKYRSARTDRVITVCNAVKRVIVTTGKIDPERVEVVYAGTDMARFDRTRLDRSAFRAREGIPQNAFVILQSGTRAWKGWREVVDAFADVRGSIPDCRLLIAGNDSDRRERRVREYLATKGLSQFTHVLGYRDDMDEIIHGSDVTVDASWAGTGITGTIRESMAVGTAVIATDCGGNRELLSDPGLGWLVEPKAHDQLVAALLEVASDPGRRAAVARSAEVHVRRLFSIERRIDRLEEIYESCVALRQEAKVSSGEKRASLPG